MRKTNCIKQNLVLQYKKFKDLEKYMANSSTSLEHLRLISVELQKNIGCTLYDKLTIADICKFIQIFEDEWNKLPYRELTFPRKLEALPTAIAIWKKDYDERHKIRAIGSV